MKKENLPKVLVILGPTAVGKSDIAVKLARKYRGEVISADSRQVYKGLDIGTGKITPDTKNSSNFSMGQAKKYIFTHKGIPHYLIDVVSPKKTFNVTDWKKLAEEKIETILKRSKLPIICGGTGFYIQSIVDGVVLPEVPPNKKLRKELEKKSLEELVLILKKLDKDRIKNIDTKNPVRLIRAIEIAKALGKVPKLKNAESKYDFIQIGITLPQDELRKKIEKRLLTRIKKGMIKEAENLLKKGVSLKRMKELGLEYKYLALFLEKKITKQEMLEKLNTEIWHYAKRQITWFKRDKRINWFKPNEISKIERILTKQY